MLITEDLLLLITDDETGKVAGSVAIDTGLGGALLVDLAAAERVSFSGRTGKPIVHVVDPRPLGHPVLDEALRRLAEKRDEKAAKAVDRIGKGAKDAVYDALAHRGIVRREEGKVLGLFPRTTWPAADGSSEAQVRAELHGALVQGTTPTVRAAALSSLLLALGRLDLVVDKPDRKLAKQRAKVIAEGDAIGDGVAAAIKAAQDAAMIAVMAATTATAAAGASS